MNAEQLTEFAKQFKVHTDLTCAVTYGPTEF